LGTGGHLRNWNIYSRCPDMPREIYGCASGQKFLCRIGYGRAPAVLEYLQQVPGSTQRNYWLR